MKISPANVYCFKNPISNVNKIQSNVFLKNNKCDCISFTGVKENKEGKTPFSYERETRKPSSYGSKTITEAIKDTLSVIDKKTNKLINKANKVSKKADELRKNVVELFDYDEDEAFNGKKTKSTILNDNTYLLGVLKEETGDVVSIKTTQVTDKKNVVINTYNFNEYGQLESYASMQNEKIAKMDLKPDEIVYSSLTKNKEKKKTANVKFGEDDVILYAGFKSEKLSYDISRQKNGEPAYEEETKFEKKSKDGKKTSVVKTENKRKRIGDTIQYE